MNPKYLAALKSIPLTAYAVAGLLALGVAWFRDHDARQRQIGALKAETAQLAHEARALKMTLDSLDRAQKPQTAAAVKWRTRWNTVKAQADTQWLKPDSVPVPVEVVREIVHAADTAITTCTQARLTCEQRVGIAQKGWANAEAQLSKARASLPRPGLVAGLRRRCGVTAGYGATLSGGKVGAGPSVAVGCLLIP